MNNPFNISFGKKPHQYISRFMAVHKVVETFSSEYPSTQVYLITGLRGSGKTVLMTEILQEFKAEKDWITIELNPEQNLLNDLVSKLYNMPKLKSHFVKAKLDLSLFGVGVSLERNARISTAESLLNQMFEILKKQKKKLLITIDEVTNSQNVKTFASAFQIFIRQDYELFLLMTGLYENIYNLQNVKTLTFLYRAPKLFTEPLNAGAVRNSYMEIFDIPEEEAAKMASLTKGYAFAYQLLGYIKWEHKNARLELLLREYDQYLQEFVYDKIWSELSGKDRKVIKAIAETINEFGDVKVGIVLEKAGMTSSLFSSYRERLTLKGIIDTSKYGHVSLTLPRFADYVKNKVMMDEALITEKGW